MEAAVTDDEWADLLKKSNDIPILVDFWAPWCGPCKQMAPVLDWLRDQFSDTVYMTKLDVDENPVTAGTYGIRSIPTLLLIHNEKVVGKEIGYKPKHVLKRWLEAYLNEDQSDGFSVTAHKKALKAHTPPPKGD